MKKIFIAFAIFLLNMLPGAASAADVQLGAGDMLRITVFNQPDLTLETKVTEAGTITFPLIGEVAIGGITAAAAEAKIADKLKTGGFIRNPQVNINVTAMNSQQISVLGQVAKPGRYPLDGRRTITEALAIAGGVSPDGSDEITLIRTVNGKPKRSTVDLLNLVRNSDEGDENPVLVTGDVVFVERAPRFYIYGEVQKPGAYKLERNMIVLQALSLGGGLTPRGTERGVRVKRRDANGVLQIIDVKLDDPVKVDDIVYIKESLF